MGARTERLKYAMETVGISITMAAITTAIAGATMFLAEVLFFQQFGTFLLLVMVFGWSFAVMQFLPLLSRIGPQDPSPRYRDYLQKAMVAVRPKALTKTTPKVDINGASSKHAPEVELGATR